MKKFKAWCLAFCLLDIAKVGSQDGALLRYKEEARRAGEPAEVAAILPLRDEDGVQPLLPIFEKPLTQPLRR